MVKKNSIIVSCVLSFFLVFVLESKAEEPSQNRIDQSLKLTHEISENLDKFRNDAKALLKDSPNPELIKKAIKFYEQGLLISEDPKLQQLVEQNSKLMGKAYDFHFEMAALHMQLGDNEPMLKLIDTKLSRLLAPSYEHFFSPDMRSRLASDPRYQNYIRSIKLPSKMGLNSVIGSPYREELSAAQKTAGLSLFWAEARRSFVHFNHVPDLDWDAIYLEYLDRVTATKNTQEYYSVMMELAPLLHDGHTNIYPPKELYDVFYSRPAISTELFGDKLLVTKVHSSSLIDKIKVGSEILAIDDLPIREYAEKYVEKYVSSSSPQDRSMRIYSYQLLSGPINTTIKLTLRNAEGKTYAESVIRGRPEEEQKEQQFKFKMLNGNISYLNLNHFENADATNAFKSALPQILKSNGLILDLRDNGGGSTNFGLEILSFLSRQPIPVAFSMERQERNIDRARENAIILDTPKSSRFYPYVRKQDSIFEGKVVVLVGPKTFSAAEDFLVSFVSMKRGILVGSPTGGSTGQPLQMNLPGGGMARICIKHDYFPDDSEFIGKGIIPDIQVQSTSDNFREGRDVPLEEAIKSITHLQF
ncbi:S41 family peptidase [Undibacterium sp. Ji67W]|uniref:S41 family peptidase n=1 Tax=Undibacterium sp. Ji67W TaxID=3413042 RepID=UPI003BF4018B